MEFPERPDYSNFPPIRFTPDSRAVAIKQASDAFFAIKQIYEAAKNEEAETLDVEHAVNCLKVAEYNLADLCKTLGVETDSANEREERTRALRSANMRIHELQGQIGAEQSPEAVQHALKSMHDHLNKWWDMEGFGHISEFDFGPYGAEIKLSCHLFGHFGHWNDAEPVTNKQRKAAWIETLKKRGFTLVQEDRDWHIDDCDSSRQAIIDLISLRLPSAKVQSFENYNKRKAGFILRSVTVYLRDIGEIASLPVPPEKKEAA